MGYLLNSEHLFAIGLILVTGAVLWILALRARKGHAPRVRPITAFDQLPTELGQAAETGAAIHVGLGSGIIGGDRTLTSIAGLQVLEGIADAMVTYDTIPIVTVGDPTLLPFAQDVLRRACIRVGMPEKYDPSSVRYISSAPYAYALGARDVVKQEHIQTNVLAGAFEEEAILLTHVGEEQGLTQVTAADQLRALAAMYPADTLLAAGEELYAGGARLRGLPHHLAGLAVQDLLRVLLIVIILLAVLGIRLL